MHEFYLRWQLVLICKGLSEVPRPKEDAQSPLAARHRGVRAYRSYPSYLRPLFNSLTLGGACPGCPVTPLISLLCVLSSEVFSERKRARTRARHRGYPRRGQHEPNVSNEEGALSKVEEPIQRRLRGRQCPGAGICETAPCCQG